VVLDGKLRDCVSHFLLCDLIAAVFLAMLCERSESAFLASDGVL